jgi:8-oxo-dGTP pyrophosphatase MutT (NUDIX family)
MFLVRHFTATGFVVHNDHVALHWHPKVGAWLPPGGHIEENEDPVQAVIREIEEESGLRAEVVSAGPRLELEYPGQVTAPFSIMVEDIHDPVQGYHQHIDMIYFCRLTGPSDLNEGWRWVSRSRLAAGGPLDREDGSPEAPPSDVRVLAKYAFQMVSSDAESQY